MQANPFPVYPVVHMQSKLPLVFMQEAFVSHWSGFVEHSSISALINSNILICLNNRIILINYLKLNIICIIRRTGLSISLDLSLYKLNIPPKRKRHISTLLCNLPPPLGLFIMNIYWLLQNG